MYTDLIRDAYNVLSPGYRRVADYLVNHYRDAAFMTAAEVAKAAKVDTTLVVRFAQRLGYPGYPELIEEVQERVKQDLRSAYEPSPQYSSVVSAFAQSLSEDRNNLEYMRLRTDPQMVDQVVEMLMRAHRIFLVGESVNGYITDVFAHRLFVMGLDAHTIPRDTLGQAQMTIVIQPEDVMVGIGMTELTPTVLTVFRSAHALGAKTIGIVGTLTNGVARESDVVLHAPITAQGLWPSITPAVALLSALMVAITVRQGDKSAEWVVRGDYFLRQQANALREQIPPIRDVLVQFNPTRSRDQDDEVTDGGAI